jgi:2-polyprenyl-3-methyl-5-hydroxy-6-metoxy-1,4-benzoquinol methylase
VIIPQEATRHFKRQCEFKRLEVLCNLLKEGDKVLDVGCGIGTYTSIPLSYLPVSITAIDSDPRTIVYAKQKNHRSNLEFVYEIGEYLSPKVQYDLIVCSHILEHIEVPWSLLIHMRRLLKDDGLLYVAIPNGFGWFEMQNFLPRMLCKAKWGRKMVSWLMGGAKDTLNADSPHIRFFTVGGIKRLLEQARLRVVAQANDEFLGGIVLDRIMARFPSLARWNVEVADNLPAQLANGWIFICRKA